MLLPTAHALGIDPVHFGVVAVVNIMLGLITPPYGLLLFIITLVINLISYRLSRGLRARARV